MLIQVDDAVNPELQRAIQAEAGLDSLRIVSL
jgi:hypothetical protein